ncbi:transcriptional regulator [Carbonactinospora thermoautotrophica]
MSNEVLGRFQRAADSSTLAEATVQDFEQITARHRGLYWQVPAPEFSQSVAAHARLGLRLLRLFGPDGLRQRLARAAGETAMMAGRLAFFDLHQPSEAEKWYQLGLEASREAGDHALAAAVLAHAAFVPAYRGDAAKARDLIRAARAHATHHTSPLTRAWLYAVEAEITAKLGEAHTSLDRIARAEGTLGQSSQHEDPAWLDFFDAGRLDGFAGFCYLAAQHTDDARRALHASLDTLGENAVKQRVVVLADIATSHVLDQEVEHACATLHQALDHLDVSWYAIGAARIREVREQLDPWDSVTAIRELDDRIYSWGNTMRVFTG